MSSTTHNSTVYFKLFQNQIDNLSLRCKQSENKLIDLIQLLTNVPDPFPALDELVRSTQQQQQQPTDLIEKLQIENNDLKQTLTAYSNGLNLFNKEVFIFIFLID